MQVMHFKNLCLSSSNFSLVSISISLLELAVALYLLPAASCFCPSCFWSCRGIKWMDDARASPKQEKSRFKFSKISACPRVRGAASPPALIMTLSEVCVKKPRKLCNILTPIQMTMEAGRISTSRISSIPRGSLCSCNISLRTSEAMKSIWHIFNGKISYFEFLAFYIP